MTSLLTDLDSVLDQLESILQKTGSSRIPSRAAPQADDEKKEPFSSSETEATKDAPSGPLCPVTGWPLDPVSKLPIDPVSGKAISKKQFKKLKKKKWDEEKKAKKEEQRRVAAQKLLEAKLAGACTIKEDPSLAKPVRVQVEDLLDSEKSKEFVDKRIEIHGWVANYRAQKTRLFLELRDGTGVPPRVQIILEGDLANTREAILMSRETSMMIRGRVLDRTDRCEKSDDKRPVEVLADFYTILGASNSSIEGIVNKDSGVQVCLDQRHWIIRNERPAMILKMRCWITQAFRDHFYSRGFIEVTPPTMVQTQVEGGSTLFELKYFEEKAYLTQSSQLYLETVIPSVGKAFCMMPSYRAEKSHTRRHLAEYMHVEGEMPFIDYENLLEILEDMVTDVCDRVMKKHGSMLNEINPKFISEIAPNHLKRPFMRMTHEEAIKFCNDNGILNEIEENGKTIKRPFRQGEDISEKPERAMTDLIGKPIFLIKFPAEIKSFYMSRDQDRPDLTESVDLLMPSVGEIIGGSMRETDFDRLTKAFAANGIDPSHYYWYNDLRKYGTCQHGGFGLGLERFLCWMLDIYHIRDAALYPRMWGRCKP